MYNTSNKAIANLYGFASPEGVATTSGGSHGVNSVNGLYGIKELPVPQNPVNTPSLNDFLRVNGYQHVDQSRRAALIKEYRETVLPVIAQQYGEDIELVKQDFDRSLPQEYRDDTKPISRGWIDAADDIMITAGNAIFGLGKSVSDFINPDSFVSRGLDNLIKEGHDSYSDYLKDQKLKTKLDVTEAKAKGEEGVLANLDFYRRNPVQAVSEVGGNLLAFGGVGKAAQGVGYLVNGVKGATTAAQGAMMGTGAAIGAGEVRGNIYEHIMGMKEEDLLRESSDYRTYLQYGMDPKEARRQVATAFAKHGAEIAGGAALGGATSLFGVEKVFAGLPSKGIIKTTLGEAAQEAVQEGGGRLLSNIAIRKEDSSKSLYEDVAANAATGALLGGIGGSGVSLVSSIRGGAKADNDAKEIVDQVTSDNNSDSLLAIPKNNASSSLYEEFSDDKAKNISYFAQKFGANEEEQSEISAQLTKAVANGTLNDLALSDALGNHAAQVYLENEEAYREKQAKSEQAPQSDAEKVESAQASTADGLKQTEPRQSIEQTQDALQNEPSSDDEGLVFGGENNTEETSAQDAETAEQQMLYSRSPMKSVEANIARGRERMTKAILDKADVKRGMYNGEFGWVDFVWGDDGVTRPLGRNGEPAGRGIAHIFEARQRKDGLNEQQVSKMLVNNIVETIAKGTVENKTPSRLFLEYKAPNEVNGHKVILTKGKGSNSWILTGYELDHTKGRKGEKMQTGRGSSKPASTHIDPTHSRVDMGASLMASDSGQLANGSGLSNDSSLDLGRPTTTSQLNDTHAHSQRGRGVVAENDSNVHNSQQESKSKQKVRRTQAQEKRIHHLEQVIEKAIGKKNAQHIEILTQAEAERPDGVKSLNLSDVEGYYDPATGKVTLIADNLTERTAVFVAWHELGHLGIDTEGFRSFKAVLGKATAHPQIRQLTEKIMQEREGLDDSAATDKLLATEEAVVELLAAKKTGDWEHLESKYGVKFPNNFKGTESSFLSFITSRLREIIGKLFGLNHHSFSNAELFDLLGLVNNAIDKASVKPKEKGDHQSLRYSLNESPDSAFAKAVDEVVNGNVTRGYITMGSTPDVLKMLGLPDVKIRIQGKTIQKVMGEYLGIEQGNYSHIHNLTPETLKLLPKQINDPVAVFKSSTTDNGYVVLTELSEVDSKTGREKPVIAALHLKSGKDGVEIIDVASAYGRSNHQIQTAFENDALYLNKEKAQNLNTERLQLPWDFTSDNELFNEDIKTEADLSQYQSENSSNNAVLSEKVAYEQAKKEGKTELTFKQWKQVRTPEFKRWFGDWENNVRNVSKVVDENTNEPLVLYHGSGSIFNVYDPNKMGTNGLQYGAGFYFTDSESLATAYSKEGGEVQKVYLNIRKWLSTKKISITDKQIREILSEIDNINEDITEDGVLSNFTDVRQDGISQATSIALKTLRENKNDIDLIDELTSLGGKEAATKAVYNVLGAVGNKVMLPGGDMVYIVLASNQIKSATRNNGKFDAKNEDIRFSRVVNRSKKESLEKLRQSESIKISGKEIQASEDLKQYKRNALEYGKSLRGTYVNKDTGRSIELSAGGVKEVLQHDYKNPEHLQSIAAIPQIIEQAIYIDTLPNEETDKNFAIDEYEYYVAGLNIGGTDYTVRAVVGISKDGDRYYDHKLSEIDKGDLLSLPSRITNPVGESASPLSDIDDKRLLQILQDNSASDGNIRFSRSTKKSSKEVDAEYLALAKRYLDGDKATEPLLREMVEQAAQEKGFDSDISFRMNHKAPRNDGYSASADNVAEMFGDDIYSRYAVDYFGHGTDHKMDAESINVIQRVKDNPEAEITVYRAMPRDTQGTGIGNGDWVTTSKRYAHEHGEAHLNDDYKIVSRQVLAKQLFTDGNSIHEWGVDTGQSLLRSKIADREKLSDLITYDDNGDIIPLSQRFDSEKRDIRFSRQKTTASNAEVSPLEDITDKFNQELAEFVNGQLTGSHIFNLGKPSELLKSVGFPDLPIELKASKLSEKANTDWHKFDIADVKGLPNALQNPLAVFSYGDKTKSHNVITQLEIGGKQLLVGVHFNQNRNGLSVNSIRGLFPKDNAEWLNWIGQKDKNGDDKHLYLDKQKIQTLINQQRTNLADVGYLDLDLIESLIQKLDGVNEDVLFSRKVTTKQADEQRTDEFARKAEVLQGEPVYTITERKAPKENSALRQWAIDLFNRAGGKVVNPEIGEVILNERSIKDSMAHGMNPGKAMAFEAIPAVIEKGVLVAETKHDRTTSYFISAPIDILGDIDIATVLVRKDMNTQKMYIHSVTFKEKLLNKAVNESTADANASEPHGKLYSGDIASILQKYLTFNGNEDSGKKFSRKREIEEDAKVKIQDLVSRVRQDKTLNEQVDLMPVPEVAVKEAEKYGLNIKGFTRLIDSSAINHILNKHGNEKKEVARGQLPIRDKDFVDIIEVYNNPDKVVYGGKTRIGRDAIFYIKKNNDDSIVVVEESRTKRRKLALTSMRKYPSTVHATSILKSLNLNAQSDFDGNRIIVEDNPAPRNSSDLKFSRKRDSVTPQVERTKTVKEIAKSFTEKDTRDAVKSFFIEGGKAPQPQWLETLTTLWFDGKAPVSNVLRRFANTTKGKAFEHAMRTYQAVGQKTTDLFLQDFYEPMMADLKSEWKGKFKKHYKDLGGDGWKQFLEDISTVGNLVKHGRERNAVILRKTEGKDTAGSGRTNEEIEAIEKALRQQVPGLIEFYESLYKNHLKPMLDYRDKTLKDSGLLTDEMIEARDDYQWYVPLYGDPNEDGTAGNGFFNAPSPQIKDIKDKKVKGRAGTLADNVIQNVMIASESAIKRASQQPFLYSLFDFLESMPAARAAMQAKINTPDTKEIIEKYVDRDGIVKERIKPSAAMDKDAIVFRNGHEIKILKIGHKRVLEALQGLNKANIEGLFALQAKATRALSAIYTRYNPMFPLMNKVRDSQAQMSFILADAPVKNPFAAAMKAVAYNVAFTSQWRKNPDSAYHVWREKYERLGGATMYIDLFRDDVMQNISEDFAKGVGASTLHQYKAMKDAVVNIVDGINEHMEMTSRVAAFKALVESGMTEKEAALYVKNLMNFETRGKYGQQMGAVYSFANAALYDARRMMQSLRTTRGSIVMTAHIGLMFMLYGALKALAGDDEDGIARLNKVPLSSSGRFLTFIDPHDPEGKGYKIPVGFGFGRISLTIAAAMHRFYDGVDTRAEFVENVVKEGLASNLSPLEPIDISISKHPFEYLIQQFSPTVVRPLVQLSQNKTGQGYSIRMPDEWIGEGLKFEKAFPATNRIWRDMAKQVYDSMGVDLSPEVFRFLTQSYLGSGGMEIFRGLMLADEKAGTELTMSDIPLAQAFSFKGIRYEMNQFIEKEKQIKRLLAERKYAMEQGNLSEFDSEHPGLLFLENYFKQVNKELKKLKNERKTYELITDPMERQRKTKEINERIRQVQMWANKAVRDYEESLNEE